MSDAKPAEAAAAKGGKKKLIVILLAVVVLLAAAGGGALFFLKKKQHADDEEGDAPTAQAEPARKHKAAALPEHPPVFVPLDPFVVNLADRDADRYLQLGVTLQVQDAKVGEQIKGYMPAIRNNILLLLARKTAKDMAEHDGKEQLAEQVRAAAVRGMGIEVDDEEENASAPAKSSSRRKSRDPRESWPIEAVQFSSFLIQ